MIYCKKQNNSTYWLYGKHAVEHAINNKFRIIYRIILTNNIKHFVKKYAKIIKNKDIKIDFLTNQEISGIIGIERSMHQSIAIKVKKLELYSINKLLNIVKKNSVILFLDQITNAQNIGSIIRSSFAFNVDAVITTKYNSPSENAALVKSAVGVFEYIPYIQVANIFKILRKLKEYDYWIISISQNGKNLIQEALKFHKIALIIGSEQEGIRRINLEQSDLIIRIKMSNKLESLNVASITAIVLHQLYIS